jgi:excisionase family DNA binding protein
MARIRNLDTHPDPFVTPTELAEHLKVSLDTIHRAIRSGALTAVRVGPRLVRVRTEDAQRFLRPASASPRAPRTTAKRRPQR